MFVFIKRLALFPMLAACLNVSAQAATYFIDNPTLICKRISREFAGLITQDGDDFLEFDEANTKRSGGGDRYNGVIVGEHASMLLNWPGDEQSGILTVLAADYPCRAPIPQKSCSRSPPSRKARRGKLTSPKRMNPGLRTGRIAH